MKKKLPKIGTKILYGGKEHTILAYNPGSSFLVDNYKGGHQGAANEWRDENNNEIPYVEGDNRFWLSLTTLRECIIQEPEFIFHI